MFVGYAYDHTAVCLQIHPPKISTCYIKQRCKMDEHYVESIYEKTEMYQPWVTDNR